MVTNRAWREMPTPVLALPCGSRSNSRTFFSGAAKAVARFTAVVVLPTPPFWLAMAIMRGATVGFASVVSSRTGVRVTGDVLQSQNTARGVGQARRLVRGHLPLFDCIGQFFPDGFPLGKQADCSRTPESLGACRQFRVGLQGACGHHFCNDRFHPVD